MSWYQWFEGEAERIRSERRWRELGVVDEPGTVSFASNDYLGLAEHPAVVGAAREALGRWGAGAGSSRLIAGTKAVHVELEAALAGWRGAEAALVVPTGYQANLSVLTALGGGARIVSDELNHASIIDGARLARAEVAVYRHCDAEHAAALVKAAPGRALVVSDTVFSMDGDVAPVAELSDLSAATGALLVLDDAHAVFDVAETDPTAPVLRVGTLSKSLGSQGGYVAGPKGWVDVLVNRARPFIFTTGLAPSSAAAALAAVQICRSEEGSALRAKLRSNIEVLAPGHPSPIVPVMVGDEQSALAASAGLLAAGFFVPAIRPPTVPPGSCRVRVSVSASHRADDLARLARLLAGL